jgi:hypothetical protein
MQNIASTASPEKRQPAAPHVFSEGLGLPAHLASMDAHARARLGPLLDAKRIKLVLDCDGQPLVVRRRA